jgi:phosphotransferase system  glucose/maltose/N-acetylglucosamine-specific IIC component
MAAKWPAVGDRVAMLAGALAAALAMVVAAVPQRSPRTT